MKTTIQITTFLFFIYSAGFSQITGLLPFNTSNNITLPGGNYIVKDILYDEGTLTDIGIVSLYDGATNSIISSLKGESSGDKVGDIGLVVLSNGNFLVFTKSKRSITWIKNNIVQNLTISTSNSFTGFNLNNYDFDFIYPQNAIDRTGILELSNSNFLIIEQASCYCWAEPKTAVHWVDTSLITNTLNNSNTKYIHEFYQWSQRSSSGIQDLITFSNSNVLLFWRSWGDSFVSLTDGNNGNLLGKFTSNNSAFEVPRPPIYRCIKNIEKINEDLVKIVYKSCEVGYPPIRLNAQNYADPLVEVYIGTNLEQSGAEPFVTCEPFGANPISQYSYSAKVWLTEKDAINTNGNYYVSKHFEITPLETGQNLTGKVKLYFTQDEFDNYNTKTQNQRKLPSSPNDDIGKSNLQVIKFSGVSSNNYGLPDSYSGDPEVINPNDTNIIWNGTMWEVAFGVTGFSGFFVSTEFEMPLPVNLIDFSVKNINLKNEIKWQTSLEINTESFIIEKSLDAKKFHEIGVLKANNKNETNFYQFTDHLNSSIYTSNDIYYRLKIKDLDGKFTYSKIISAVMESENFVQVENPIASNGIISINTNLNANFELYTATGMKLDILHEKFGNDKHSIKILGDVKSGVYFLKLISGETEITRKIVNQ